MPDTPDSSLIQTDIDLQSYNTLNIPARAKYFAAVSTESELKNVLAHAAEADLPVFILGGGSNILFANNYEGLIVRMNIQGKETIKEDDAHIWLRSGAGENWHGLVRYCVDRGWGGIENLSLIPGRAGAAPIQNIGAYGAELSDVFVSLEALEIETGRHHTFDKEACRFGYRDSIFKNELRGKMAITSILLKLSKNPTVNTSYGAVEERLKEKGITEPTIRDLSDVVTEIRNSKLPDPADVGNAGSFFKNPVISAGLYRELRNIYTDMPGYELDGQRVKVPAGWLIEKTGWKGRVVGNTGTYNQQALVIVNHGGATGREILDLAGAIARSVKEEFGIELVPEVNIVH